jgi:transcriptional regulator with XRE-family HTH domain
MATEARPDRHAHVDDAVEFGRRLKQIREEREMSQRELSFPGCTAVYICRLERGDRVASLQVIQRLAAKLNVEASWLAFGIGERELRPMIRVRLPEGTDLEDMRLVAWLAEGLEIEARNILEGYNTAAMGCA